MEQSGGADRPILVVVADDTQIYAELLADAIRRDHRIQVVASVSTSHDLLEILARLAVDVVVISSNLDERPDHGFQVLGELRLSHPGLGTLLLLESSRREA